MVRQSGSPKSWCFLVVLLIGAGGLLGCASSDSGTMVTENADITYTMAPNTIVVTADDAAGVDFVDLEAGDIFLRPNSTVGSSVEVGKVLAFSITDETPNGLLRKVTAVNQIDAGLIMVETEQATLLEAFDELDLTLEQPLHFEGLANYQSALNGVAIQQSALAVSGSISKDFEINFDQTVLFDLDGDKSTTYDRVVADGEIQFSLGLALEVKTNYLSLKRLKVGVAVEEDSNLVVHTTLPSLNFEKEIVVAELFFPPISIGPVVVTVTLELVLGANGELKAQVSSSVTHSMQASVGTVLQNGSWSPYSDYSSEWNFQPPTLSASARLKAYLGPRVNLMIYGAAGPYAMATGYLELAADISKTPWWQLFVGLEAFVGIRGEILGIELMDFRSGDLLDFRKVLAEAKQGVECVPDCSGRECGPDPVCQESCGTCSGSETCNASGQCVSATCVPDCSGRECGPDPVCGESCGTCTGGKTCSSSGQCVAETCVPDCSGRVCGPDPVCGESCGTCTGTDTCNSAGACVPGGCGTNCGEMVTVPADPFWQGCNDSVDSGCYAEENPYHQVMVPAFKIDKYEVTIDLYGDCVNAGYCSSPSVLYPECNWGATGRSDHPVNCITWDEARAYCEWAGKRLCSESEWEKASRGTDGRKYPWGNETATCEYAVMDEGGDGCGTDSTWPVGSKPAGASPYGALDMSGNVWEWVEDDWHDSYTGAPMNGSAWVDDPRASGRVRRGGGFTSSDARVFRASHRYYYDSTDVFAFVGVRCCVCQ